MEAEVEAARRDIDAHEIAQIPRAKLEPLYVDFGCVAKDAQQHITLTNSGQVGYLCEEAVCCAEWAQVTFVILLLSVILPDTDSDAAEMCLMNHVQRPTMLRPIPLLQDKQAGLKEKPEKAQPHSPLMPGSL